jgi:hypothetical protein
MKLVRQFSVITIFCFSTMYVVASDAKATKDLSTLPVAAQSSISAALGRDLPDYHIHTTGTGLESTTSHGALITHFTRAGVEFTTDTLHWKMALRGYGYGDAIKAIAKASPHANQNRVEYRRGPMTEWYMNGPVGLEQGFTLAAPPGKRTGKPLTFAIQLSGNLTTVSDPSGAGLSLQSSTGITVLNYSGLSARDAEGRALDAQLQMRGGRLFLEVRDISAKYPVTIDPIIQLAKLEASDGAANDYFGSSVAASGNTIVVSQFNNSTDVGAIYVFVSSSGQWRDMTETAKLTPSEGIILTNSLAISGDTVIVGDLVGQETQLCVFVKPPTGWTDATETAVLTESDGFTGDSFGKSAAIDGDTIVVGALGSGLSTDPGAVYIYIKPSAGWTNAMQTAKLTDSVLGDWLGAVVSVSGDTIVAGAPFTDVNLSSEAGVLYVYVKPSGGWADSSSPTAQLTAFGSVLMGEGATAISGDTIVAGNINVAFLWVKPEGGWTNMEKTAALTDGIGNDAFGGSVSIKGNAVVVGAEEATIARRKFQGAAYVFQKPAAGWRSTKNFNYQLLASDGRADAWFGWGVAIAGDDIVVSANRATVKGNSNEGAAYVFGP